MISARRQGFFAEELYLVCESRQPVSLNKCNLLFITITPSHLYVQSKGTIKSFIPTQFFASFLQSSLLGSSLNMSPYNLIREQRKNQFW